LQQPKSLAVTRLTLTDFRCYAFLRLDVPPLPVVLTGPNGAGKTNILEALSFLAPGRGLRRVRLSEAARRQAGPAAPWAVAVQLSRPQGTNDIGTGRESGSERRSLRIDGQPAKSQAALADLLSVLWLTPAMDRLFIDGPGGRRRFLDRLVMGLDAAHGRRAAVYEHSMRERSRLLQHGGGDAAWLTALEETMARQGVAMAAARRSTVQRLNDACGQGIGPFPAADLTVRGEVEGSLDGLTAEDAEARLRDGLAAARRHDADSGGAGLGPHRSDLAVRHRDKDLPAQQCSTGEQKAVLVSIILGQARLQEPSAPPILLLDEIAAHLDRQRRAALFDELSALSAQSWLTGTDEALFAELGERGRFFRVDDAVVTAV